MRKVLISIAAAGTALAFATPASAQYFPQSQPGYGYGYNQGGYNRGGYGQVRMLQARVDRIQGQLDRLAQQRAISRGEYRALHGDSHRIESRLRQVASYGLDQRERYDIERRIARLEQRIVYEARDGRGWGRGGDYHAGNGGYYGQSAYRYDQDRDGLDDRYEDDRGRKRDRRGEHGDDHDDD
ncbi:MAG: hypothetical protein ABIS38_06465 [Sphingomicrobium sp.]